VQFRLKSRGKTLFIDAADASQFQLFDVNVQG